MLISESAPCHESHLGVRGGGDVTSSSAYAYRFRYGLVCSFPCVRLSQRLLRSGRARSLAMSKCSHDNSQLWSKKRRSPVLARMVNAILRYS